MALSLLSTCKTTQTLTYSFWIYSLRLLIIAGVLLTPSQIFFVSFWDPSSYRTVESSPHVVIWKQPTKCCTFQSLCFVFSQARCNLSGPWAVGLRVCFPLKRIISVLSECYYLQIAGQRGALPWFWASVLFSFPSGQSPLLSLSQGQLLPSVVICLKAQWDSGRSERACRGTHSSWGKMRTKRNVRVCSKPLGIWKGPTLVLTVSGKYWSFLENSPVLSRLHMYKMPLLCSMMGKWGVQGGQPWL